MKTKVCSKCGQEKPLSEFHKRSDRGKRNSLGVVSQCKECKKRAKKKNKEYHKNYHKKYYQKNKQEIDKKNKIRRENNLERFKEQKKEYDSRPEIREKRNKKERERRKNDVSFKLRKNVSRVVNDALKRSNANKLGGSTLDYLPYTIQQLKEHLESQFEPWMSWDNYGRYEKNKKKWHIDHINPQSKLIYDSMSHPNFIKCWSLDNLRPLEATENIKKSNKVKKNQ